MLQRVYCSVAEGGGRGVASGLWLEWRVGSMLRVMLGGDLGRRDLGLNLGSASQTHRLALVLGKLFDKRRLQGSNPVRLNVTETSVR